MRMLFAETLKKIRTEKGLSQKDLAERLFVTRSTIARWENGSRLPDAFMLARLSDSLGINIDTLLHPETQARDERPNVIMVEDRKIILSGSLPVLEEVMPNAAVTGFTRPTEAVEYAKNNRVALAMLDIELGKTNGLELCNTLLDICPQTNVIFLTAYSDYAFDAWKTGASGFMLKPITAESLREQLKKLRHPFFFGGTAE